MARTPGMYVPLDMNYMRDRAIRKAGPEAEHLFIRSLAYSKSGGTDGIIADYDLDTVAVGLKAVPARVQALVREHLWDEIDGGWYIHSWAKWNMTRAELDEDKKRKSDAAIQTNHTRYHEGKDKTDPKCIHCAESLERVATPIASATATPIAAASLREVKRSEGKRSESEEKVLGSSLAVADGGETSSSSPSVEREAS